MSLGAHVFRAIRVFGSVIVTRCFRVLVFFTLALFFFAVCVRRRERDEWDVEYDRGRQKKVRKITPDGHVKTLAGTGVLGSADGIGTAATFQSPRDVDVDANGNVYVADYYNFKIRKIAPVPAP